MFGMQLLILSSIVASTPAQTSETEIGLEELRNAIIEARQRLQYGRFQFVRTKTERGERSAPPVDAPIRVEYDLAFAKDERFIVQVKNRHGDVWKHQAWSLDDEFRKFNMTAGSREMHGQIKHAKLVQRDYEMYLSEFRLWRMQYNGQPLETILSHSEARVQGAVDVDGVRCIRAVGYSAKSDKQGIDAFPITIDFDVDHDLLPRKLVSQLGNEPDPERDRQFTTVEFKKINGSWFPTIVRHDAGSTQYMYYATEVELAEMPESTFRFEFPPGSIVSDFVRNEHYIAGGEKGKEIAERLDLRLPEQHRTRQGPKTEFPWRSLLAYLAVIGVLAVGLRLLRRRRKRPPQRTDEGG